MSIKNYFGVAFCILIAKFSYTQKLPDEFIKEYRTALFTNAGFDTTAYCLNTVIVLKFSFSKEREIRSISCSQGIAKEMQMKLIASLKKTQPLWKEVPVEIDTSYSFIQMLFFDDDSGCSLEAKNEPSMTIPGRSIDSPSKKPVDFSQMKKRRDYYILRHSYNVVSLTEMKNVGYLLPAMLIKKTI